MQWTETVDPFDVSSVLFRKLHLFACVFPQLFTRPVPDKMTSQMPLTLLFLLLLPVYCWSALPSQVVRMNLTTIVTPNHRLSGDPYLTLSPHGLRECAEVCKRRPRCLSFNFKRSSATCELNDRSSSSAGASLVSEEGTIFSDSSSWPDVSPLTARLCC